MVPHTLISVLGVFMFMYRRPIEDVTILSIRPYEYYTILMIGLPAPGLKFWIFRLVGSIWDVKGTLMYFFRVTILFNKE